MIHVEVLELRRLVGHGGDGEERRAVRSAPSQLQHWRSVLWREEDLTEAREEEALGVGDDSAEPIDGSGLKGRERDGRNGKRVSTVEERKRERRERRREGHSHNSQPSDSASEPRTAPEPTLRQRSQRQQSSALSHRRGGS